VRRVALVVVTLGWTGCGGQERAIVLPAPDASATTDAASPTCPHDLPATCPSPAPSWAASDGGVQDIVNSRCVPCHQPGGLAFDRPFTTYAAVYKIRGDVLGQIYSCYMPPPDAGALDDGQRQALLGWLVCGAPAN
jgi:hypothetical protein